MKVCVLGAGRVGAAMALDLARDGAFEVTAVDRSREALAPVAAAGVAVERVEPADAAALDGIFARHDLVVGALPGAAGFEAARRVLDAGRDLVDISFFPEDPFQIEALARERGVRAVVDAGVAPGLGNLVLGHLDGVMESTESFECLVGGLPARKEGPWEYRAPFSPRDVVEEYTRPVRLRRGGQDLILSALDEVELVELPGVGTLEAFLTDGLRTLLRTVATPTMVEKTLRYPGHVERVKLLRDSGFFGTRPIEAGGVTVRPVDVTARLLEEAWRFREGEEDLTVLRLEVVGRQDGARVRHVFDLLDRHDRATGTPSMARTTGYTCTALVRWLARGGWEGPGLAPPEVLGRASPRCLDFVLAHLGERGVEVAHRVETAEDRGA